MIYNVFSCIGPDTSYNYINDVYISEKIVFVCSNGEYLLKSQETDENTKASRKIRHHTIWDVLIGIFSLFFYSLINNPVFTIMIKDTRILQL